MVVIGFRKFLLGERALGAGLKNYTHSPHPTSTLETRLSRPLSPTSPTSPTRAKAPVAPPPLLSLLVGWVLGYTYLHFTRSIHRCRAPSFILPQVPGTRCVRIHT